MTDNNTLQHTRPKPPSILSGVIFLGFKVVLISLTAWFVLLLWFFGEFLWAGQASTLTSIQHIVALNNDFMGHEIVWLQSLRHLQMLFPQGIIILIINVTEIILARCFICYLAMPLFALFLLLFVTDGLVQREIRKFQGARESTLIFHRAKLCVSFSFFVPLFIFLSLPVYVSPMVFLPVQALMLSVAVWFMLKYFKKVCVRMR